MNITLDVFRKESPDAAPYRQKIVFSCGEEKMSVAMALRKINAGGYSDENGNPVSPIRFEESCGQKKCGACAMLINGYPHLACDTFLSDFGRKKTITLDPLAKFPCVADLMVDRSIMMENLKNIRLWAESESRISEKDFDNAYDASLCLQCGCCLEACPNFYSEGEFFSAAAFAPLTRLLPGDKKLYREHVYDGCGKALACEKACPIHLPLDRLLSRSNAVNIWRRKR